MPRKLTDPVFRKLNMNASIPKYLDTALNVYARQRNRSKSELVAKLLHDSMIELLSNSGQVDRAMKLMRYKEEMDVAEYLAKKGKK